MTSGSITAFLLETYGGGTQNDDEDDIDDASQRLNPWILAANATVSISVLITYPLQLYPAMELLGPVLSKAFPSRSKGREERATTMSIEQEVSSSISRLQIVDTTTRSSQPMVSDFVTLHEDTNHTTKTTGGDGIWYGIPTAQSYRYYYDRYFFDSSGFSFQAQVLALVLFTYIVAVTVPNVECLISLSGALSGSFVALLIPPMLQIGWLRRNGRRCSSSAEEEGSLLTSWDYWSSILLFIGGFVFMCIGAVASISDIISVYRAGGE